MKGYQMLGTVFCEYVKSIRGLIVLALHFVAIIVFIGLSPLFDATSAKAQSYVQVQGKSLVRDGEVFEIRGVNYYPKDYAWIMWENYSEASGQIDQELDMAVSMGINTIRFFLPYDLSSVNLSDVQDFVDKRLESRGLLAIVTLFDIFNSSSECSPNPYASDDYPDCHDYIDAIVNALGNTNANILSWDIRNEPDCDYGDCGEETVQDWLVDMAAYVKSIDGNHLVTIGFNGGVIFDPTIPGHVDMVSAVDFVSFHYFDYEDKFEENFLALQDLVGNKPVVLEEFGLYTCESADPPHTEFEQAAYYNALLFMSEAKNMAGRLFWTLNDFSQILDGAHEQEHCFGVLRNSGTGDSCEISDPEDYSQKDAADIVMDHYRDQIKVLDEFNGRVVSSASIPGWTENYRYDEVEKASFGATFKGYGPEEILECSHREGSAALFKHGIGEDDKGEAVSSELVDVDVDEYPFLLVRIADYKIRDPNNGSNCNLNIFVENGGQRFPIASVAHDDALPSLLIHDLRTSPTNWSGSNTFEIVFQIVHETGFYGYSATYEFDYVAIAAGPVVNSLSPSCGPVDGGTEVQIQGENFAGDASVAFGGVEGTDVSVSADGSIVSVKTPAHVAGSVDVTVTNPLGLADASLSDTLPGSFTYISPCYVNNQDGTCGGNSPCYTSLQQAVDGCAHGSPVRVAGGAYDEALLYFQNTQNSKDLYLQGLDSSYAIPATVNIEGSMTIEKERLIIAKGGFALVP